MFLKFFVCGVVILYETFVRHNVPRGTLDAIGYGVGGRGRGRTRPHAYVNSPSKF